MLKLSRILSQTTHPIQPEFEEIWQKRKPIKVTPSDVIIGFSYQETYLTCITLIYNNIAFVGLAKRKKTDPVDIAFGQRIAFERALKKLRDYAYLKNTERKHARQLNRLTQRITEAANI